MRRSNPRSTTRSRVRVIAGVLTLGAGGAALAACATTATTGESVDRASSAITVSEGAYEYDRSGLPTKITAGGAARAITRTSAGLTDGTSSYDLDALGRTTRKGTTKLRYGADGQLASVTKGSDVISYVTDENGKRLAKKKNGVVVEAYVEEGVLAQDGLTATVRVDKHVVGVVKGKTFGTVAADARGTIMADGTKVTLAAPFGERTVTPDVASAIDFAESGSDADLAAVRMGVRDYDPEIHRFLTPDPLFLAHPEKCVDDPVSCNLYSYAANRPADFVDPNGTDKDGVPTTTIAGVSAGIVGAEVQYGQGCGAVKLELGPRASLPSAYVTQTSRAPASSDLYVAVKAQAGWRPIAGVQGEVKIGLASGFTAQGSANLGAYAIGGKYQAGKGASSFQEFKLTNEFDKPGSLALRAPQARLVGGLSVNTCDAEKIGDWAFVIDRWLHNDPDYQIQRESDHDGPSDGGAPEREMGTGDNAAGTTDKK